MAIAKRRFRLIPILSVWVVVVVLFHFILGASIFRRRKSNTTTDRHVCVTLELEWNDGAGARTGKGKRRNCWLDNRRRSYCTYVRICVRLVFTPNEERVCGTRDFHGLINERRRFSRYSNYTRGVLGDNIACDDAATCSTFVMTVYEDGRVEFLRGNGLKRRAGEICKIIIIKTV